jgi:outer membrane lipopolysaccharide assembly protein LptE/RlpB
MTPCDQMVVKVSEKKHVTSIFRVQPEISEEYSLLATVYFVLAHPGLTIGLTTYIHLQRMIYHAVTKGENDSIKTLIRRCVLRGSSAL